MTLHDAILFGEQALSESGIPVPRWNAERILMLALRMPRSAVYADLKRKLTAEEMTTFKTLIQKRGEHYPLAYMEGTQEFFGREFKVNDSVLIPRPETEEIVRAVLRLQLRENPWILDVGSGSGNIAVSLANEISDSTVIALERSAEAIAILKRNGKAAVKIVRADFHSIPFQMEAFDCITANLPYVERQEFDQLPAETKWEPEPALLVDSLEHSYRTVMEQSTRLLRTDGYLLMEFGFGQMERLRNVAASVPGIILENVCKDQQGIERILVLRRSEVKK